VEVHPSARRHGITDEDALHAIRNALVIEPQDDDVILYLGPTRTGALLEIATVRRTDAAQLVIHAMPMRAKYRPLLAKEAP
jgi:hypothetical protein